MEFITGEPPQAEALTPGYMTRDQAAHYLGVTVRWMETTARQVGVPVLKFGGHVRYDRADLDRWARQQRAA